MKTKQKAAKRTRCLRIESLEGRRLLAASPLPDYPGLSYAAEEIADQFVFSRFRDTWLELWSSENAGEPAKFVATLPSYKNLNAPFETTRIGEEYFFSLRSQHWRTEAQLWRTDGSPAGTETVAEFSDVQELLAMGDHLIVESGDAIFKFNPSTNESELIYSMDETGRQISLSQSISDKLFSFRVALPVRGHRHYLSDGTVDGTRVVQIPENGSSTFTFVELTGGLAAYTRGNIIAVAADGSVSNVLPDDSLCVHDSAQLVNGRLYFEVDESESRIWSTDGTTAGTMPLTLQAEETVLDPLNNRIQASVEHYLFFRNRGQEYVFDTITGTTLAVVDTFPVANKLQIGTEWFFSIYSGGRTTFYRYDFQSFQKEEIAFFAEYVGGPLMSTGNKVAFTYRDGANTTVVFLDTDTGHQSSKTFQLEPLDQITLRAADDAIFVRQANPQRALVWRVDSDTEPAAPFDPNGVLIAADYRRPEEVQSFSSYKIPYSTVVSMGDGNVAYLAQNGWNRQQLLVSDGTWLGTHVAFDHLAFDTDAVSELFPVNGGAAFITGVRESRTIWTLRVGEEPRPVFDPEHASGHVFDILGVTNGRLLLSIENTVTFEQSIWAASTSEFTEVAAPTDAYPISAAFRDVEDIPNAGNQPLVFRVDSGVEPRDQWLPAIRDLQRRPLGWHEDRNVLRDGRFGLPGRRTLWVTDGTSQGTHELFDPAEYGVNENSLHVKVTFHDNLGALQIANSLFVENGVTSEYRRFPTRSSHPAESSAQRVDNTWIIFQTVSSNDALVSSVWRWADDEAEPQQLLNDVRGYPLARLDGNLYFQQSTSYYDNTLWRTDGTLEGTQRVSAIMDLEPTEMRYAGKTEGRLIFLLYANDPSLDFRGEQIVMTDGSAEGTRRVNIAENPEPTLYLAAYGILVGDVIRTAGDSFVLTSSDHEIAATDKTVSLGAVKNEVQVRLDGALQFATEAPLIHLSLVGETTEVLLDVDALQSAAARDINLTLGRDATIRLPEGIADGVTYTHDPGFLTISLPNLDLRVRYKGNLRVEHALAGDIEIYTTRNEEPIRFSGREGVSTITVGEAVQSLVIDITPSGDGEYKRRRVDVKTMGGADEVVVENTFQLNGEIYIVPPITGGPSPTLEIGDAFDSYTLDGNVIRRRRIEPTTRTWFTFSNENHPHTNPMTRGDVNADGRVEPLDALRIINQLNRQQRSQSIRWSDPQETFFGDVSGDGLLTPEDALLVINQLNREARSRHDSAMVDFVFETEKERQLREFQLQE